MKKVGLIIASQGYQPIEYGVPEEMLTSDGIKVITISDKAGVAIAKDNSTADVDMTVDQVDTTHFDGIFIIGGPGALEFLNTPRVHDIVLQMRTLNKGYGAICVSSRILAEAGALKGKKATGWNQDHKLEDIFKQYGVTYVKNDVVVDGKVVTATGPHAAQEFALAIIQAIKS